MKKIVIRLLVLLAVAGAGYGAYTLYRSMPQSEQTTATTKVRQGDVIVRAYARGELRAVRSATLLAPNLFGTIQVTNLAPLGAFARDKDLIVEFDDAEVQSRLEEKQLEIDQIDENIKKAKAELAIRDNQDQVELLRAQYGVRRAELEVKRNPLLSDIDQQRNNLTLQEARKRLTQLESDIKSRKESAQAEMAVLDTRRSKAVLELNRDRQRLSQVKLLAPMSGLVSIRQNLGGSFRMMGAQVPDIREGDQLQAGIQVADILDLSELEVMAKVGELDRANLHEGQEVMMRLDAVPEKQFSGKIKAMSATASANPFAGDPAKKFDVIFSIDMRQLLSALGTKPDQINRILAQAEQNRKKPLVSGGSGFLMGGAPQMMAGGPQMMGMQEGGPAQGGPMQGGPMQGGAGDGPQVLPFGGRGGRGGAGGPGEGGGRREGGARGEGGGRMQMSDADRAKLQEVRDKILKGRSMQELSEEERTQLRAEMQKVFPNRQMGGPGMAAGARGERGEGGGGRRGRGEGGGEAGGDGGARMPGMGFSGGAGQFSAKDLENAKLPPPPEEDSQLDVLLRPGLLADVEIIVEKMPNAIHIPAQAVVEKEGKLLVYVQNGGKWEAREIKPLKRSESTLILASGVKPGETIALGDPTAKPGEKKNTQKNESGGGAMGGMPGSGRQGGQ